MKPTHLDSVNFVLRFTGSLPAEVQSASVSARVEVFSGGTEGRVWQQPMTLVGVTYDYTIYFDVPAQVLRSDSYITAVASVMMSSAGGALSEDTNL